jgi:hypothetical protein
LLISNLKKNKKNISFESINGMLKRLAKLMKKESKLNKTLRVFRFHIDDKKVLIKLDFSKFIAPMIKSFKKCNHWQEIVKIQIK